MITYFFDVTQTTVKLKEYTDEATQGNINQIKCIFNLSDEYKDLNVDAVFNGERVPIVNSECYAPSLNEVYCTVGVIGYIIENDKYKLRISPNPTSFIVKNGSYHEGLIQSKYPEPSELERHYSLIKELVDSGKLQGPPGPDGPQGIQGPPGKDAVIDTILSPESSNAIANSTVAKVLNSGKLLGIETIFNEADYHAFNSKYENIGENEYVVEVVPYDIQIDDWILNKSISILTKDDSFELADVDKNDFESLKNHFDNQIKLLTPRYVHITENTDISTLESDIIYQVNNSNVKYTSIVMSGDSSRSFWLANGETFYISTQGNGKKGLTLRTNLGYYHIPDINEPDWSRFICPTKDYVDNLFKSITNGNEVAF